MRSARGFRISRSMLRPVKRPMGLSPRRMGETSDHTASANAMRAALLPIDARASASWNGVRNVSGALRVARARMAWRTVANVTRPR